MSRNQNRRSPFRFLFALLVIFAIAAGAFGGLLYSSLTQIRSHADAASESYKQCLALVDQQQYGDALSSARLTADEIAQAKAEFDGWQWDLAGKLPYLSTDVACARQTTDLANALASDALLPVVVQAEDILGDLNSEDPLGALPTAIGKIPTLYSAVTDARKVVADCKTQADALPTSHFDEMNTAAASVKKAATDAEETFSKLDVALDAIDTLGEIGNQLISTTETTDTAPSTEV